jgi:hypothetical protein
MARFGRALSLYIFVPTLAGAALLLQSSPTGLVGYWKLDETAAPSADSAGGAAGTWVGTPAPFTPGPVFSFPNPRALSFDYTDGTDDYVEIPNTPALENLQENSYTISAWFRPADVPPTPPLDSNGNRIESTNTARYAVVVKAGWHLGIHYNYNRQFVFEHWETGDQWRGTGTWTSTYDAGQWYHLCGVWNRTTGTVSLWVNGTLAGQTDYTDGFATREYGTTPWRIGIANPGAGSWRWAARGAIDDVRFYNRVLSDNEIRELNAGLPAPTGLTATGGVNQMSLSWTAPAGFVGSYTYDIYRAPTSNGPFTYLASTTSTSYVDPSATYPGSYYYYVVAVSTVGESGPSAAAGGSPQPIPPRTGDHEEGLMDGRCSCGAARPPAVPLAAGIAFIAAAGLLLMARRPT